METIKLQSCGLRGRIVEELADASDHFSDDTAQLLRQHGIYQQDNRDKRLRLGEPSKPSGQREYNFMLRAVVPAGRLSSEQFLAHLDLCQELGNGALRLTWRQNLQIDGVRKENLAEAVRRIHATGLTTLGGGGDMRRNVMCCPAPYCRDPVHRQIQGMAFHLFAELCPRMPALWRDLARPVLVVGRRWGGRAAVRQGVSAAEVQDGRRSARRQLRRPVRAGRRADGHLRELPGCRLQRVGGRGHGDVAAPPGQPSPPWPSGWP